MRIAIQYTPGLVNDNVWTEYGMEIFFEYFGMDHIGVLSQGEKDILLGSALVFGCRWRLNITVVEEFSLSQYLDKKVTYFVKVLS